jgi:hypothetical protein
LGFENAGIESCSIKENSMVNRAVRLFSSALEIYGLTITVGVGAGGRQHSRAQSQDPHQSCDRSRGPGACKVKEAYGVTVSGQTVSIIGGYDDPNIAADFPKFVGVRKGDLS